MDTSAFFLLNVTGIFVLGIGAQWLSWRLRLPSILLLLLFGFFGGPIALIYWPEIAIRPDQVFGEQLLLTLVSLSVALILFEGGLSLKGRELLQIGVSLSKLLTIGVVVTWLMATLAAYYLLRMRPRESLLLGAILVVTGPTVIGPLLRHVRPIGKVSAIARWEGIIVDPIGAVLAVLVFEIQELLGHSPSGEVIWQSAFILGKTLFIGGGLGVVGAIIITVVLRRYWVPDHLHNPVALTVVVAIFTTSNLLQHESGLVAVTVMGIVLANQTLVTIHHIIQFKENISVLLIGSLFILLAARTQSENIGALDWRAFAFVAVLMIVIRPAAVFLSMLGSPLNWREKVFLSWLAPRGIVAAAVASLFALRLGPEGAKLVPVVFLVIILTVGIYGLTARPLALWLNLAVADPQGILFASSHAGARAIAQALQSAGIQVAMVDSNWANAQTAKLEGFRCYYGNVLSTETVEEMDLGEIGRFIALTPNNEVNALACWELADFFGGKEVYQLPPESKGAGQKGIDARHLHGRLLFAPQATYHYLDDRFAQGAVVKKTKLTKEFDFQAFKNLYGTSALPLFLLSNNGKVTVFTVYDPPKPTIGQTLISLVYEDQVPSEEPKAVKE